LLPHSSRQILGDRPVGSLIVAGLLLAQRVGVPVQSLRLVGIGDRVVGDEAADEGIVFAGAEVCQAGGVLGAAEEALVHTGRPGPASGAALSIKIINGIALGRRTVGLVDKPRHLPGGLTVC
jgi:hypothetical protein